MSTQEAVRREITHRGLTMNFSLCRNHFGKFVIHGYVNGEERMSHQFERRPSLKRILAAVVARLDAISQEVTR